MRELQQLNSLRSLCRWLDFDDDCWELAAQAARQCREQGATVPLGDVLVFACAQRHDVDIIEHDQHFAQIAKAAKS
jgi:predicted nucleic acid-binding protein